MMPSEYSNATTERMVLSAMSGSNQDGTDSTIGLTIYDTDSLRSSTIDLSNGNDTGSERTASSNAEVVDFNRQHILNEINKGNELIEAMQYRIALKHFEGANLCLLGRRRKEDVEAQILVGMAKCRFELAEEGRVNLALKHCNQALKIQPWNESAISLKIQCLLELHLFADALEQIRNDRQCVGLDDLYQEFLEKYKMVIPLSQLEEFVQQGYAYFEWNEYDNAFGYFDLVLFFCRNPEWLAHRGMINVHKKSYLDGISDLKEAFNSLLSNGMATKQFLVKIRHELFNAYMETDQAREVARLLLDHQNICERCTRCNARKANLPQIFMRSAQRLANGGQVDQAIENLDISLEMNWTFDVWQMKADILANEKRFSQLLREANVLLSKQPIPSADILLKIQKQKVKALNGLGRHFDALWLAEKLHIEIRYDPDLNRLLINIKRSFKHPITCSTPSNAFWHQWKQRSKLPMWEKREQFMEYLEDDNVNVIVVAGGTGSGKTTQIPQWCAEFIDRKYQWQFGNHQQQRQNRVVCTQTTRKATIKSAQRVCRELGLDIGEEIGYSVRFDNCVDRQKCQIKYCTEGILLAEICTNPSFQGYSVVICDEVHRRKVETDMLLAALKRALANGHRLKIVIMSATLTFCIEKFRKFFGNISTVNIPEKRLFSVRIEYPNPMESHDCLQNLRRNKDSHIECFVYGKIKRIYESGIDGHILVFLAGTKDIKCYEQLIKKKLPNLNVLQYHSKQNENSQESIFQGPIKNRKCILATDIAETSLTIPGIGFVIDLGNCKRPYFLHNSMANCIQLKQISKSSATQRAGRAGRTQDGICYRMYDEYDYERMEEMEEPEIEQKRISSKIRKNIIRADLVPIAFKMIQMKLNLNEFMDPPLAENLEKAHKILGLINAIDANNHLTEEGQQIAKFTELDPRMAKALISSAVEFNCSKEMLIIVSMLSEMDGHDLFEEEYENEYQMSRQRYREKLYQSRKKFAHKMGMLFVFYNYFHLFERETGNTYQKRKEWCRENFLSHTVLERAKNLRQQLQKKMKKLGLNVTKQSMNINDPICMERITRAFLAGYYFQVADLICIDRPLYAPIFNGISKLELKGKIFHNKAIDLEKISGCIHRSNLPARTVAFHKIVKIGDDDESETTNLFIENTIVVRHRKWIKDAAMANNAPMNLFDFDSTSPSTEMCHQCMSIIEETDEDENDDCDYEEFVDDDGEN